MRGLYLGLLALVCACAVSPVDAPSGADSMAESAGGAAFTTGSTELAAQRRGRRSSSPYGRELVSNGSFEVGFAIWAQNSGGPCTVAASDSSVTAPAGSYYLYGGSSSDPTDCQAYQELDLLSQGFSETELDRGDLYLEAEVWLANEYDEGTFDDQSWLQLWYLDESGEVLSSLRTLIGGDDDWRLRRTAGLVPAGTRTVRVEVNGRQHTDGDNDAAVDVVSVVPSLQAAVSPSMLMLPQLQDWRTDSMRVL